MTKILLDMNVPRFQKRLFSLEKVEQRVLLNTLDKIIKLSWKDFYQDKGIRWELIISTTSQINTYSFRFSKKYRSVAYRDGNYLVLLDLFVDHDGAYT